MPIERGGAWSRGGSQEDRTGKRKKRPKKKPRAASPLIAFEQKSKDNWFNDKKGFGFIKPAEGGKDIFVHFSGIVGDGHRTLKEGESVIFDIEHTLKGPQAKNVIITS